MEGVEVLQVIWVSLQVHLAQEFILQDSVIPNLKGDRGWRRGLSKARNIAQGRWGVRAAGPRSLLAPCKPSQGKAHGLD